VGRRKITNETCAKIARKNYAGSFETAKAREERRRGAYFMYVSTNDQAATQAGVKITKKNYAGSFETAKARERTMKARTQMYATEE
jgi:hypothetical protein